MPKSHHLLLSQTLFLNFLKKPEYWHYALFDDEFDKAAYAIAAHLRLAAVDIQYHHANIGNIRIAYDKQAVSADAGIAVQYARGKFVYILDFFLTVIYQHHIVAQTVHLGKAEFHPFFSPQYRSLRV